MTVHSSGKPFWTEAERASAIAAANAGEPVESIASRHGRTTAAVRQVLCKARKAGVGVRYQTPGRKRGDIDDADVHALHRDGKLNAYKIAARLNVSHTTVYRILRGERMGGAAVMGVTMIDRRAAGIACDVFTVHDFTPRPSQAVVWTAEMESALLALRGASGEAMARRLGVSRWSATRRLRALGAAPAARRRAVG